MDWSFPGEILAVGGHKRINDSIYNNQIIFYTRRGEFLHRVHIPQTVRILFIDSEWCSNKGHNDKSYMRMDY